MKIFVPGRLLSVSEFAETPNLEYARTKLRVEVLEEGEYLTAFGRYIGKPHSSTTSKSTLQPYSGARRIRCDTKG